MPADAPDIPADPRAELLQALLARAGSAAMSRFRQNTTRIKADGTPVTDGDLAAHDVLVEGLERAFPDDVVCSEEAPTDDEPPAGRGIWYVDPIDGTSAFAEGLAHWGPTVARVADGALDIGAFHLPRLGEHYVAGRGTGAWRDRTRIHAHPDEGPARLRSLYVPSRAHRAFPLPWPGKIRALGSSAAHLVQVATGAGTATFIPVWSMWDVGLGILMVEEAGRAVVDLQGARFDAVARPGEPFLAGDPAILPELLDGLRRARAAVPRS